MLWTRFCVAAKVQMFVQPACFHSRFETGLKAFNGILSGAPHLSVASVVVMR